MYDLSSLLSESFHISADPYLESKQGFILDFMNKMQEPQSRLTHSRVREKEYRGIYLITAIQMYTLGVVLLL